MTDPMQNTSAGSQAFEDVLRRMKNAASLVDVDEVRFVECECSYGLGKDDSSGKFVVGVGIYSVSLGSDCIRTGMTFEFRAPTPFEDSDSDKGKRVYVRAKIEVKYVPRQALDSSSKEMVDTFVRVNGVQTAWPYWREYLHASLARLGLPAFALSLLKPIAAARFAGLVEWPSKDGVSGESTEVNNEPAK